ncbi:acyl-CoA dehydrogenase family protein [Novosphingobium resinovorum]|uniref:Acyl-CoA dehydrogenase n=1 Tax=Novosphingobium resinovorum TaxID=158500 RepID=A0A031JR12_9SPHN|nr:MULTISPECIES: acyl-CoA dehydrogenase family protein [Novosphingobium]AOR79651.1 acyl-CoA dehydrogenase [Novosphingobium resinovorum]EZP79248.1 Acyl-CoA dehydrogenase [Novosphingobium resinovorum]MBF7013398.1 acyl-CoA dehydrogenase family protein [Novosphingobium sp. HR1a]WJM25549.1 acyl-CoA dehydrogenase family protein [Novosphingobium resinovorum]
MERLIFAEEHDQFRASAARFMAAEVAPHAERWRREGIVEREVYRKAGDAGLLCLWADPAHGGAGVADLRFDQIVIEENVRGGEPGFYLHLHSNLVAPYIAALGTPALQGRLMPRVVSGETILAIAMTEAGGGSDLRAIRTRAVREGDGWRLTGAKTYISNGILADAVVVAARTGERTLGLFVVDRGMAGFERGGKLGKMGLAAQDTAELFFNDVQVPGDNVLGDPEAGLPALMRFLATERLVAAIASIAAAQTALALTLDFAATRTAFGRPVGLFQHNRFRLAALRSRIDAAQAWIDQLVLLANAARLTPEDAAAAKLVASELEGEAADLGVQLHGGAGYMDEYRISRMYTDARISRIFAGSNEIMLEIIARGMGLDERGVP